MIAAPKVRAAHRAARGDGCSDRLYLCTTVDHQLCWLASRLTSQNRTVPHAPTQKDLFALLAATGPQGHSLERMQGQSCAHTTWAYTASCTALVVLEALAAVEGRQVRWVEGSDQA
jgi:hypothetical protein